MRFHQPVGVIQRNNCHINGNNNNNNNINNNVSNINDSRFVINTGNNNRQVTHGGTIYYTSENENHNNFAGDECLKTLKSIINEKEISSTNNFDSRDVNRLETLLKFKTNSCGYFKNFIDTQQHSVNNTNNNFSNKNADLNGNNDNDNVLLIETLNLTEDNLSRFVTSTTQAYDNCITNQSYKQQNCLSNVQRKRRENLIKLDFGSMTKHEGPMQSNGGDSAGCSVESSPVDSLLDDQDIVSPTPSSLADLSSPDPRDLQEVLTRYPRGIINPNYPGFQHLAHTLAEHFIDHNFDNISDSEISDDVDFDVTYRRGSLIDVNIMNDSNNNNNNGTAIEVHERVATDLNQNKNRRSSFSTHEQQHIVNDFDIKEMKVKEYEDGNVNLLMKSEPKVFCESKQLGLNEDDNVDRNSDYERFTSDDEDEECCNLSSNIQQTKTNIEPQQMEFDEDDMADLSGEDDAAIKNELERIDRSDNNDFNENINCDLATYLQQYDYKMDLQKSYQLDMMESIEDECLTDEDNNKLPTPDILIEHNSSNNSSNKKLQNDTKEEEIKSREGCDYDEDVKQQCIDTNNVLQDETRNFQPDLIKNIKDTISSNDNNHERIENTAFLHVAPAAAAVDDDENNESDNEILSPTEHEIPNNVNKTNDNDEKIINQVQTEVGQQMEFATASGTTKLSFDSASSTVDIIGDFGKEVEKEIGLIVSGYLNATNDESPTASTLSPTTCEHVRLLKPKKQQTYSSEMNELVLDENKFFEHLKYFSKMGDATLSKIEEKIVFKKSDHHQNDLKVSQVNTLIKCESVDNGFIPTAIVKPKYQKLSFDERQLPIRGATETELWNNTAHQSTTITTTPRKIQKHLPKNPKTFARQTRKMVNKMHNNSEICTDYDVTDKEAINSIHRVGEKDIDCSVMQMQNSVAIVQPIKKVIDTNVTVDVEKNEKQIDSSKNIAMSQKAEFKNRNSSSKMNTASEITPKFSMSECDVKDNNNLNVGNRKYSEREKIFVKDGNDDKKVPMKSRKDISDAFDVYNIETALPVIDLEAIESHLMASAKEEEKKRKNDREAIRRRLAMGEEDDYLAAAHRPIRKPNLQSRLQNGMNLQICFMNEAASDSESSDSETCPKLSQGMNKRKNIQRSSSLMSHRSTALNNNPYSSRPLSVATSVLDRNEKAVRPITLTLSDANDNNFFTHQARLQIEARMALAQAKDMAHMQMEFERQKQPMCPITELVHKTLEKVGMKVPHTKRRLSRQMLTNMNIAQLQIIINEFHSFIETLNETLVKYLMDRDDFSMRQDSMLIDIEDITRYLAEKEETQLMNNGTQKQQQQQQQSQLRQHLDPKKAFPNRTSFVRQQQHPTNITYLQNNNNNNNINNNNKKKSLVVNGNGHSSVITSISREKFEQRNRLHL